MLIHIFDKNHNSLGYSRGASRPEIVSDLASADSTISFTYVGDIKIESEFYIRTGKAEYVVKEVGEVSDSFPKITCALNLEELEAIAFSKFSIGSKTGDDTIEAGIRKVIAGTGWTVGYCDVTKHRNAGMIRKNGLGVIQGLAAAFMCDVEFDTLNKVINIYQKRGVDRGVYFIRGLNLRKLTKKSSSYDLYTRIVPIGSDGLTITKVNGGKDYLENFQYTNKVRVYIWEDSSYTDASAMKEDTETKLNDMSKPTVSYSAEIRDLASQSDDYSVLSYGLGDTVTLIDDRTGTRDEQRIVKTVVYPDDPNSNKCELSNTTLTFEEMQSKYKEAMDIINYNFDGEGNYGGEISISQILNFQDVVNDTGFISAVAGAISGSGGGSGGGGGASGVYGKLIVNDLTADDVTITRSLKLQGAEISGGTASFDSIETMYGNITYNVGEMLDYHRGHIDELSAIYLDADFAKVKDLEAIKANIWKLFVETALVNQVVTETGHVTNYLDAVEINADKITAGTFLADRFFLWNDETQTYDRLISDRVDADGNPIVPVIDAGEVIAPQTVEGRHMVAHTVTANEITTDDIVGSNGYINFHRNEINFGNKLVFENNELHVRLEGFGGTNLIRESSTLSFSDYRFESGYVPITDENGDTFVDEYEQILIM